MICNDIIRGTEAAESSKMLFGRPGGADHHPPTSRILKVEQVPKWAHTSSPRRPTTYGLSRKQAILDWTQYVSLDPKCATSYNWCIQKRSPTQILSTSTFGPQKDLSGSLRPFLGPQSTDHACCGPPRPVYQFYRVNTQSWPNVRQLTFSGSTKLGSRSEFVD